MKVPIVYDCQECRPGEMDDERRKGQSNSNGEVKAHRPDITDVTRLVLAKCHVLKRINLRK